MQIQTRLISQRYHHLLMGLLMVVVFMAASQINATVIEGIRFEKSAEYQGVSLKLKGVAVLNYLGVIRAYAGAIYLPTATPTERALDDAPKRLVLEYFRSFKAEDFRKATRKAIRKNISQETFTRIEQRLARLNALYLDVDPKDRYSLTYLPGRGTELALNAKPLGVIPGADFAKALFAIWIGPHPIDRKFKETLLGQK